MYDHSSMLGLRLFLACYETTLHFFGPFAVGLGSDMSSQSELDFIEQCSRRRRAMRPVKVGQNTFVYWKRRFDTYSCYPRRVF